MHRTKSYRRHQRQRVIEWKKRFIKLSGYSWNYEHEGTLAKGKIHCSCWMCRCRDELLDKREKLQELNTSEQIKEYEEEINGNCCS